MGVSSSEFWKDYLRMALKPSNIRRILFGTVFFGILVFLYLYWMEMSYDFTLFTSHFAKNYKENRPHEPIWTWTCASSRCERVIRKNKYVSLETCNMLCGSSQIWPMPTGPMQLGSHYTTFSANQLLFESSEQNENKNLLEQAYEIFQRNIRAMIRKEIKFKNNDIDKFIIRIIITSRSVPNLKLNSDESYNLTVRSFERNIVAKIKAKTYFGARHALETLSQLIWSDETVDGTVLRVIRSASIQDRPKFPYRGLMLDTARHFFSMASLKRLLDGMAANKLNIFHWHLTDSQSFPFDSPRVPQMAKYGAFSPEMTYSASDVEEIIKYAKVRGIRVLIEIDMPAHAGNGWDWGPKEGLGELAVCVNQQPWLLYCGEPPCGQLNPSNPNVYHVIEKLYADILDLTEERELFHMGGDEVNLQCWQQKQSIMISNNYTDLHDVWGNFMVQAIRTLDKVFKSRKTNVILWSSDLTKKPYIDRYLKKDRVIVQTWGGSKWPETYDLLDYGYRILISHVDAWYLDCGFGKWRETGEAACDPYRTWQTIFMHRPWDSMHLNASKKSLIIGAEVCLWTEQVDESSLDSRLWPRTAAFAERMWSDPELNIDSFTIDEDVYTRLNTHRERLIKRGLKSEALWPKWCEQNPGMCL